MTPEEVVRLLLGLDAGGTKVAAVLLSDDGRLLKSTWTPHHARTSQEIVAVLVDVANDLTAGLVLEHIAAGVSVAGLVDTEGRVTRGGVLTLEREDVAGALTRSTGVPMLVMNDAAATLHAAVSLDRAGPVRDAVLLALGTGVAGAVMWNGELLRGRVGLAGELGHLPVLAPLNYRCVCGGTGCLEQYASGRGLAERAAAAAAAGHADDLVAFAGIPGPQLTAIHVVAAGREDTPSAAALVDDAARAIAQALIGLAVTSEPARVYLGGSLGHAAADLLLPRIRTHLAARWPFPDALPPPPIGMDVVGPQAGAMGAALLAGDLRARTAKPHEPGRPLTL